MITKSLFDNYKGKDVFLYTLENKDVKVGVLDYGGIINFIKLNTHKGEKNICVGYKSVAAYEGRGYCGSTVGRVANRIANSKFTLNGKEYSLCANENGNCLHGGPQGFDKKFYNAEVDGETLTLSLVSPDGDMGFPGELKFKVEFTLNGREFTVKFHGVSDKDTLFSPTNHSYFNLNGGGEVKDILLKINAEGYTPTDDALIPTGKVESVKDTPYDFTVLKPIGEDIDKVGKIGTYDVNFALNGTNAIVAQSLSSGITMNVITDMPGVQLYVGRPSEEKNGEGGYGFCLEPQFFPNAVNEKGFETPFLKAGEEAVYTVRYQFGFHSNL